MSELQIFNNPEFGQIRVIEINGEPWMVGKDAAAALGYADTSDALKRHVDDEDKLTRRFTDSGQSREMYVINESGLYSLVLSSKLPGAKKFRRWVTSEVLPAIRKTGMYIPQDYPSALRALADEVEKNALLAAENERQKIAIADFQPIKQYVDTILSSPSTMTTTQIAADYGISARQLNQILHEAGLQHKVNGQWILYRKHMGKGYTKSKTITFTHSDGTPDTKLHTQWSQKGRLAIHEILTSLGIQAVMDREAA